MCGIIAVLRPPGARLAPSADEVTGPLHDAAATLASNLPLVEACRRAADRLEASDAQLRGTDGVWALVHDRRLLAEVEGLTAQLGETIKAIEAGLDAGPGGPDNDGDDADPLEAVNAAVVCLKDSVWSIERDRVRTARAVADLAGSEPGWAATESYSAIQQALSAIDRLEVRGRDSAGLHVLVRGHGLDVGSAAVTRMLAERASDPLFRSGAVRAVDGCLSFVYKAAAEIGELGDNTSALRDAVRADELLRLAVSADTAIATVLGHTRWASVGMISQPNAHPVDSTETGAATGPYVVAALNGDVDNFADLKALDGL
jgi:glutamine---fructose-6-phosphate transaminase (isomerizing)